MLRPRARGPLVACSAERLGVGVAMLRATGCRGYTLDRNSTFLFTQTLLYSFDSSYLGVDPVRGEGEALQQETESGRAVQLLSREPLPCHRLRGLGPRG